MRERANYSQNTCMCVRGRTFTATVLGGLVSHNGVAAMSCCHFCVLGFVSRIAGLAFSPFFVLLMLERKFVLNSYLTMFCGSY